MAEKKRVKMANKEEKKRGGMIDMPPAGLGSERELIVGLKEL